VNNHYLIFPILLLLLGCTPDGVTEQTPEGPNKPNYGGPGLSIEAYYSPARNASGEKLKALIHEIIDDHKEFPYSSSNTDTWDILIQSDKDPNNSTNVLLIYTQESVNGAQEYNNGSGWNREHVWAKSRGDFGNAIGMGTDVHNLRASNIQVNSARSNHSFDTCMADCETAFGNKYKEVNDHGIFEPRDDDKGDVARILFYMAVRYEGDTAGERDLELLDNTQPWQSKDPYHGVKQTLLEWHEQDPVDDFERHRNNTIYQFQQNRNPFIDHPELVAYFWGDKQQAIWQ